MTKSNIKNGIKNFYQYDDIKRENKKFNKNYQNIKNKHKRDTKKYNIIKISK